MKRSLSGMFIVSFLPVMLVLATVIVGCYSMVLHQSGQQATLNANDALNDTAGNLEKEIHSMIERGNIIADHQDLYKFLAGSRMDKLTLRDNVRSLLTTYSSFEPFAVNAYLYAANGGHLFAAPFNMESNGSAAFLVSKMIQQDEKLDQPFRQARFSRSYQTHGHVYYALCIPVYPDVAAPASSDYVGALVLLLQVESLARSIPWSATENTLIADGDLLLAAPNTALAQQWETSRSCFGMSRRIPLTSWTVYTSLPQPGSDGLVQRVGKLSIIIGSSALLLLGLLMIVLYRSIVGPIIALARQMDTLDPEKGDIINVSHGRHELNRLTDSMNSLLERIHQLNEEMISVRLKSYEEHITFLQAQINPHFLYNNFETIRGMAGMGDSAAIREMASCMAAIYRYCCKGESLVMLQQELECLQRYLRILHLRYGDQYKVQVDAPQETLVYPVPRMILQPLVENAVSHGFINAGRKQGMVNITAAMTEESMLLSITDDGVGLNEQQLEQYNRPAVEHDDGTHSHIGITNVKRRIQLIYGEASSMRFMQAPGGGLCITIDMGKVPKKWTNKAE